MAARIDNPFGLARGPDGALYFCEYTGQRIRRVLPDGRIETVAGTGAKGYSGDGGPALQATFNLPHELRFDAAGDLFVVDMSNHAVRCISMKTGTIRTIAGNGKPGYSGDGGPASAAQLKQPHSIQFGKDGSLYICDIGNHVIRRIDFRDGRIHTAAGIGKPGRTPDGAPIQGTALNGPRSLDVDREGNLWLCTREGNQVFKLDLKAGRIEHIAGTGAKGLGGNGGPALTCTLSGPKGIALDAQGNVWLADCESHTIRMIRMSDRSIHLVAGTGVKGNGTQSDPLACAMARPHGVHCDADGGIYIGDSESHRVRVLRPQTR
jgi:sugar lactone lactonase YvrE